MADKGAKDEPLKEAIEGLELETEAAAFRRDRLLAALALIAGAGLAARPAVRAARRRRILPAGHRRSGHRDRAGAAARMARAAARALGARRLHLRRRCSSPSPISRSPRSSSRRPNGCGCCPSGSAGSARRWRRLFDVYADLERFIDDVVRAVRPRAERRRADGDGRDAQFAARHHRHLGAVRGDPDVLRGAGDLLLPRRLDADAQAHDHHPGRASTAR